VCAGRLRGLVVGLLVVGCGGCGFGGVSCVYVCVVFEVGVGVGVVVGLRFGLVRRRQGLEGSKDKQHAYCASRLPQTRPRNPLACNPLSPTPGHTCQHHAGRSAPFDNKVLH